MLTYNMIYSYISSVNNRVLGVLCMTALVTYTCIGYDMSVNYRIVCLPELLRLIAVVL